MSCLGHGSERDRRRPVCGLHAMFRACWVTRVGVENVIRAVDLHFHNHDSVDEDGAWPSFSSVSQAIRRVAARWSARAGLRHGQDRKASSAPLRGRPRQWSPRSGGCRRSACSPECRRSCWGFRTEVAPACGHSHRAGPLTRVVRGPWDRSQEAPLRPRATCAQGARPPGCDRGGSLHRTARRDWRRSSGCRVQTLVDR